MNSGDRNSLSWFLRLKTENKNVTKQGQSECISQNARV